MSNSHSPFLFFVHKQLLRYGDFQFHVDPNKTLRNGEEISQSKLFSLIGGNVYSVNHLHSNLSCHHIYFAFFFFDVGNTQLKNHGSTTINMGRYKLFLCARQSCSVFPNTQSFCQVFYVQRCFWLDTYVKMSQTIAGNMNHNPQTQFVFFIIK